jgi:type II secretory pathway pseudopilin PulG
VKRGFTLLEMTFTCALAALLVAMAILNLRGGKETSQSQGAAQILVEELRAARLRAMSSQQLVALGLRQPYSQSFYWLEGNENPHVTRAFSLLGDLPEACFYAGAWNGAVPATPVIGALIDSYSDAQIASWVPAAFAGDALFIFTPEGQVRSNGLPVQNSAYHVLVSAGLNLSPLTVCKPYTVTISPMGAVDAAVGAAGVAELPTPPATAPAPPNPAATVPGNSNPVIVGGNAGVLPLPVGPVGAPISVDRDRGLLTLKVKATDADGDRLYVRWTASGPAGDCGDFSDPAAGAPMAWDRNERNWQSMTSWRPRSSLTPGVDVTLNCTVFDSRGGATTCNLLATGQVHQDLMGTIAFSRDRMQICTMSPDGTNFHKLYQHPGPSNIWNIFWSPDGSRITMQESGNSPVTTFERDGRNPKLICTPMCVDYDIPAWSGRCNCLFQNAAVPGFPDQVCMMAYPVGGSPVIFAQENPVKGIYEAAAVVSPDASRVCYARYVDLPTPLTVLYVKDLPLDVSTVNPASRGKNVSHDGLEAEAAVTGPVTQAWQDWGAAWNPAGNRIAFPSNRYGSTKEVCLVDPDEPSNNDVANPSPKVYRLTTGLASDPGTLRWSPDGRHLAFCDLNFNLWVLRNVATGKPPSFAAKVKVGSNLSRTNNFAWSPNSNYLVYAANGDLYRVAGDGSGTMRLTNTPEQEANPDWNR